MFKLEEIWQSFEINFKVSFMKSEKAETLWNVVGFFFAHSASYLPQSFYICAKQLAIIYEE
jgi:hypothetical protein